jgi:hypothetical protein
MPILGFLLLLGLTAPQDQPASAQSSGDWLAKPVFSASQLNIERLSTLTAPQDQPAVAQSSGDWVAKPDFTASHFNIERWRLQKRLAQQALENARRAARAENASTCYAIKSYIFEREDGNAPVLVATTTCTPARALQWQQVDGPPKVRLIPAH